MSEKYTKAANKFIADNKYFMISKSWCPDCHYAYRIWEKYKVSDKFFILELDKISNKDQAINLEKAFTKIIGQKWVPSIFFNGLYFGNEQTLKKLEQDGLLKQRFIEVGLINSSPNL
ncbi:glutathione-disulfide reductase GRX8 ASCRUDRAFT_69366 [Ascoidea rubescens DSM 1968]|uniref:Glutaredoxin domain-containing protein n=1 Tax=Ascoidea rubescens DSM 1968 TaxID=1344418 RepID=A0A1D2VM00_9ASCO|nr:hypothetical protein ASCRUDRAFT_69366 [Ascoidea rubescens DSM 1968]ODV62575.1 hypothetical protein ASCRUDRAFT_69366 [Ascoidea rubescens DSM 1968]